MKKTIQKKIIQSLEQYQMMLEEVYKKVIFVDMEDMSSIHVSYQADYDGKIESTCVEQPYEAVFFELLQKVDMRDRKIFERCAPEILSQYDKDLSKEKIKLRFRLKMKLRQGEAWREILICKAPEQQSLLILMIRDITDEVLRERTKHDKVDFLENLAFDIRTPLQSIVGFMNLCEMYADNPGKLKEGIRKQKIAAKQLSSVVDDITKLSENLDGIVNPTKSGFMMGDLVRDIVVILQQRFVKKKIQFKVSYKNLYHEALVGDSMRINRIILNMTNNIVQNAEKGTQVAILINEIPIENQDESDFEFYIIQNPDQMMPYMSRRKALLKEDDWYRSDTELTDYMKEYEQELVGVRRLLHILNGRLYYQMVPDTGSIFCIRIPVAYDMQTEVNEEEEDEFFGKHVLLADDDRNNALWMEKMLSTYGIRTTIAKNGRDAVNKACDMMAKDKTFDYVFLNWKMPELDGIDTTKLIRKFLGFEIPIILQSAYDMMKIETSAREAGVNFFTVKPMTRSNILPILRSMNGRMEQRSEDEIRIPSFHGKRVLEVEDKRINREIVEECLKDVGILVDSAENGKQAVDMVKKAGKGYYDLILMDIQMPEMDGYEATRRIRKMPGAYAKNIPIIALSSGARKEDQDNSIKAGMNGHLSKPIELHDLYEAMRCFMGE